MVNNQAAKDNLLANLLATVQEKSFQGVDIDFEYIRPEDRIPFADFVADVGVSVRTGRTPCASAASIIKVSSTVGGTKSPSVVNP